MAISFGDNVRIISSPATDAAGISGMTGCVYGETVPSSSGAIPLGDLAEDYAVNVFVESLNEDFWLNPSLVDFIDHGEGAEITIDGSPVKIVRQSDGSWAEILPPRKPWWRFW